IDLARVARAFVQKVRTDADFCRFSLSQLQAASQIFEIPKKTSTDPSGPSTTIKRRNRFSISAFQFFGCSDDEISDATIHESMSQCVNPSTLHRAGWPAIR